jgi:hypothetical protein
MGDSDQVTSIPADKLSLFYEKLTASTGSSGAPSSLTDHHDIGCRVLINGFELCRSLPRGGGKLVLHADLHSDGSNIEIRWTCSRPVRLIVKFSIWLVLPWTLLGYQFLSGSLTRGDKDPTNLLLAFAAFSAIGCVFALVLFTSVRLKAIEMGDLIKKIAREVSA